MTNGIQQDILLVGVCAGRRCAALRRLDAANPHQNAATDPDVQHGLRSESEVLLRRAVRRRAGAVLMSVPCLGPCSHASVTALGAGLARPNSVSWLGRPAVFGLSQTPDRALVLADWIGTDAPDPRTLPMPLRRGL